MRFSVARFSSLPLWSHMQASWLIFALVPLRRRQSCGYGTVSQAALANSSVEMGIIYILRHLWWSEVLGHLSLSSLRYLTYKFISFTSLTENLLCGLKIMNINDGQQLQNFEHEKPAMRKREYHRVKPIGHHWLINTASCY